MRTTDRAPSSDWELYPVGCGVASAAGPEVTFGWSAGPTHSGQDPPRLASLSHALAHARQAGLRRVATAHRDAGPVCTRRRVSAGNVAFLCLFAAQAAVLTLSPILPAVAREFGISTAAAGQLRTLAGLSGAIAAIAVVLVGARVGLRRLLLAGNGLLALGSAASAAAPTLIALAVAQVMIGAAGGLLISGGLAAAATWAPAGRQAKALAWASLGQPASWVAAMPLTGITADLGWRYAWLGVPLATGLAGLAAVHSRPVDQGAVTPVQRANSLRWDAKLVGWTLGELLSYAGWGGALVYAGALLVESYDAAPGTVGLLLGAAAIAAFPGNFLVRRWLSGSARELLIVLGLSAAALTAVFGTVRPGLLLSTGTFTLLVLVATTRTVAGSAFALYVGPERRLAVMGVRASTGQLGYLLGGAAGGAALAAGGYPALGLTLAALFALGTTPHIRTLLAERAGQTSHRIRRLRVTARSTAWRGCARPHASGAAGRAGADWAAHRRHAGAADVRRPQSKGSVRSARHRSR